MLDEMLDSYFPLFALEKVAEVLRHAVRAVRFEELAGSLEQDSLSGLSRFLPSASKLDVVRSGAFSSRL